MEPILPRGHQPVTSIPKGAMSVNISELRYSSNFLGISRKTAGGNRVYLGLPRACASSLAFLTNNLMC